MTGLDECDVLEVSTPELDDVVRLEDRYGRVDTKNQLTPRKKQIMGIPI